MQTLQFRNGDAMPALGLGTWQAEPGVVGAAVRAAVEAGYRHIDCAAIYGNEPEIGEALATCFAEGIVKRDDLWITSKLWNNRHAPDDVQPALEQTLSDLRIDALDLYLVHWPIALRKDVKLPGAPDDFVSLDEIPLADTWGAMERVVERGLTKHIGVSNFSVAKVRALVESASIAPEANQVELHPYLQQEPLVSYCRENGIAVTAYSPLGSPARPEGLKQDGEPVLLEDPVIGEIARSVGATPAQVLIRWAIERGTSVIPKSVRAERLRENLAAADLELGNDAMRAIAALDRHRRYIRGDTWTPEGAPYTLASLWDE